MATKRKRGIMDLTIEQLQGILNVKTKLVLYTYLGRAEFSHIKRDRLRGKNIKHRILLCGITEEDIKRFKDLINRKRGFNYV